MAVGRPDGQRGMTPEARSVTLRDGALSFKVLSAGRGAPVVYFHSIHEREGWSPFLDGLARRHTVHAPFHPGVGGSTGLETLDDRDRPHAGLRRAARARSVWTRRTWSVTSSAAWRRPSWPPCSRPGRRLVLISPLGLWRDDAPSADLLILPAEDLPGVLWRDPGAEAARRWAAQPETDEAEEAASSDSIVQRRAAIASSSGRSPTRACASACIGSRR